MDAIDDARDARPVLADHLPVALRLEEGVELATAWVGALARRRGIRTLIIKGETLSHHGLRPKRDSADIDVLVEPSTFDDFCEALIEAGWTPRQTAFISKLTTVHSVSFIRDGWPCDIDAHRHFPGFLAPPEEVFESLWRRREPMAFAHQDSSVPSRPGALLVMALHSLRTTAAHHSRQSTELKQALAARLSEAETAELGLIAVETGCVLTAEPVLLALGVDVPRAHAEQQEPAVRAWRERSYVGAHNAYFWIVAFRSARWRDRPQILRRAAWPVADDMSILRPELVGRRWLFFLARVSRLRRGFAQLPGLIRDFRHARAVN